MRTGNSGAGISGGGPGGARAGWGHLSKGTFFRQRFAEPLALSSHIFLSWGGGPHSHCAAETRASEAPCVPRCVSCHLRDATRVSSGDEPCLPPTELLSSCLSGRQNYPVKHQPGQVTSLCKPCNTPHFSQCKSRSLTSAPYDLMPDASLSLLPLYQLVSFLFLEHAKNALTPGPLHRCSHSLGMIALDSRRLDSLPP